MGAYLNKPVTEKHSEEGEGEGLKFGATCMQGWRVSQEDAHNCIVGLVEGWSLFAVYDGHGGSEVSKFTSLNFPEFLKKSEFWKNEEFVQLLERVFIEFDDHIRSAEVMAELRKLAGGDKEKSNPHADSDDENDRIKTIEESNLPLEQILARYGFCLEGPSPKSIVESLIAGAREEENSAKKKRHSKSILMEQGQAKRAKTEDSDDPEDPKPSDENDDEAYAEGKINNSDAKDAPEEPQPSVIKKKNRNSSEEAGGPESIDTEDSTDEEDADFVANEEEEDNNDEEEENDAEEEEEEDEDEEEEEEDDDEVEEDEVEGEVVPLGNGDTPGDDSGTTACVCLISKTKIVVANVGDSRAVLSRGGVAINLSEDHKPEDEKERNRIENAGGTVTGDGRVNGGLNLSRALGDHCYKKNNDLKLEDQMISALPDVKIEDLKPEDEFVVVACDGIWNSLESQDVVNFVKAGFVDGKSCQKIAEDLCDKCMAENSTGDGSGCDNETCIIIQIAH